MTASVRVTRRASTASERFLASAGRRSNPAAWLIGGIAASFAIVVAFILLGGAPPPDFLEEKVAALEEQAMKAPPEEAIRRYEELLRIAGGIERFRVKAVEWRRAIKDLREEITLRKRAIEALAAFEKEVEAADAVSARALLEKGFELQRQYPRLWAHERHLDRLRRLAEPVGPPGWQVRSRDIAAEFHLERRGEARWGEARRAWMDYLKLTLAPEDRQGAENALRTVELKARDEIRGLRGRGAAPEALKAQRHRFEGTAAAVELEKAIGGP